jgi:tetratricopeptide (TPR) repeat protein
MVFPNLFIPERSDLFPQLTQTELQRLFSTKCLAHPDIGFVDLTEELDFTSLIELPVKTPLQIIKPHSPAYIPSTIKSFQVQPIPKEEVLKNLSDNIFPKHEKMKDQPLNPLEKLRLGLYNLMFRKEKASDGKSSIGKTGLGSRIQSLFYSAKGWQNLEKDFEDLEQRNQKKMDRLMDLLKNNPEEGLKYAIPLDNDGTTRGGHVGEWDLSRRWLNFSLFGNSGSSSGGAIASNNNFYELQRQYQSMADDMMKRNDFQKAAFIYLKLLKNHEKAAEALEAGKYYQEAATIYLQKGNKIKAASCYEKGNMTAEAIALYTELNDHEKVGDLYMKISNRSAAMIHYQMVVKEYKTKYQYIKASSLCLNKMGDLPNAQSLLLEGWRDSRDAANCLGAYFSNIPDEDDLHRSIQSIYKTDVTPKNRQPFFKVIQSVYRKHESLKESLREMAFEIGAA